LRKEARQSPGGQFMALYASVQMQAINGDQNKDERIAAVAKAVKEAKDRIGGTGQSLLSLRVIFQDVVTLYGKENWMAGPVEAAQKGLEQVDHDLKGGP
jgi:hypothetical protein